MDFIRFSIEKPVTIVVGVILIVMFGLLGLASMPYQLSPNVVMPKITVTTNWTGATPYEMERDIIEEQEKVLKGVTGLTEMESQSYNSHGEITLTFEIGTNVDDALLRVSNKLNEVRSYPDNAERPVISATGANTSPSIWMIMQPLPGNDRPITTYQTFFENEVRQYLERVEGVADLFVGGGTDDEMHIIVDPAKLAAHNLTIDGLIGILSKENVNVSAGNLALGRRDYRIRTVAEFASPADIAEIVISSSGQRRIRVRDVAEVRPGYEKEGVAMLYNGEPGFVVAIKPEPGVNILDMTDAVEVAVKELNDGKLKDNGIFLNWVQDERPYINGAIDLVKRNIMIGAILACIVLLVFLRSIRSTVIVAMAIPISILGSFIFLNALGRTLNIVSMAGISFAVGMLVDNAIVVLENIDRHRLMGKQPLKAAYDGTKEVWGAVLASTLTTVAVFLPVVFIEEEAGQLFKDIALAVTCAIVISLFVSVSVIPMLAAQLFKGRMKKKKEAKHPGGNIAVRAIMGLVSLAIRNWFTRIATVISLTGVAVLIVLAFFPKMEYLPQGNRNLIINVLIPPPGLSIDERREIGEYIFAQCDPLIGHDADGFPGIKDIFYVGADRFNIFGAVSMHEDRAAELIPFFSKIIGSIPGMYGVSIQVSIFQTNLGEGRNVSVDFSGPDMNSLIAAAGTMFGMLMGELPGAQIRPMPSLELLYPEVSFLPDRDRVKAAGMSAEALGVAVDVLMDGRKIGDYKEEGQKTIDLVLMASDKNITTPEELYSSLVATPQGTAVPLSSLAHLERTYGITQIRHLERNRTVTLQITPPKTIPLQQAMEVVQEKAIPALKAQGLLSGVDVTLSGAADKLTVTRKAMQSNFLLALAITYLLMAALFGNFIYPFIILFTVPLAAAGGFLGLKLENLFIAPQPMDIVTMLGFVILVGIVVNNAILIVHQSLNNVRERSMAPREAVLDATRTRLRPIYMSATTSIFGMLPLAVAPGPGSELYRGLGSVVLGGLALSTVFTIFVIPSLLVFFIRMEKPGSKAEGRPDVLAGEGAPLEQTESGETGQPA